jgi:transcriptional regulator with XRE-family HTH domain
MAATPELMRFADNLRAVRKREGVSQLDLGYACGVHPSVIARIEAGNREPRLATIVKLARGLGVPASDLMSGLPLGTVELTRQKS